MQTSLARFVGQVRYDAEGVATASAPLASGNLGPLCWRTKVGGIASRVGGRHQGNYRDGAGTQTRGRCVVTDAERIAYRCGWPRNG